MRSDPRRPGAIADRSGSIAVEFALIGPLFIFLLIGLVVYGGWFWIAQGVQHLAAEGARAAVAALDAPERERLARGAIDEAAKSSTFLSASRLEIDIDDGKEAIRVIVTYDASTHPVMALSGLVPAPPRMIERAAAVHVGGYGS